MGTTTTTNHGFIKPDDDEPAENWPTQNATNQNNLDAALPVSGNFPGQRIATTVVNSDSADLDTTETIVMSVTANLVIGRTYEIWGIARFGASAAGVRVAVRIREDDVNGTQRGLGQIEVPATSTLGFGPLILYGEYTAVASGNKTFVLTGDRNDTSGETWRLDANASNEAYMFVNYNRG